MSGPLRLLFVVQRYGPEVRGGAEHAAREVAERLAARGHQVEVLTTTARSYVDWSGDLPEGATAIEGVTVHRLRVDPLRDPATFDRLHHRMETAVAPVAHDLQQAWLDAQGPCVPELEAWLDEQAARFDVVVFFTYLYGTTTAGLPTAARHRPVVLVPCAHDEPPLALHVFDRVAHLADALVFLTPEEGALVQRRFRSAAPQHVVGLGADLDPVVGDEAAFRAAHGLGGDPYLLYVGRIDPSKGTTALVDAFTALGPERPEGLRLVLLGEAVAPPEPAEGVVLVTDADDAARNAALAGAVALVHPSPFESFGMVVTEAWAVGTPVIALRDNDVLRGHVERSGGGLLVGTVAELGAAAQLLCDDTGLRRQLGEAGRAHAEARYAWPVVLDGWERALRRAATRGPRPPRATPAPAPPPRPTVLAREPGPLDPSLRASTTKAVLAREPGSLGPALRARTRSGADREDGPPRWLAAPLAVALCLLVAGAGVGVVAAILGVFSLAVVAPLTLALGVPAAVVIVRALPTSPTSRSAHLAAALAVTVAAVLATWHGVEHGEHLVADRDPGVYLTTARHLMDEGDVLVPGPVGPFAHRDGISPNGAGFSPIRDDGTLEPQFPHLTAVLLAIGGSVREIGLFLVTPALAGLGLLCLYAWATTVVGPRWSLAAVALTGVTMPFLVFARDAYSEPATTVLAFGGLWLLHVAHRSRRLPPWLVAGLTLGATNMARVDSFLYLAPLALALTLAVRLAGSGRRDVARHAMAFAAGVAVTTAIGLWDTATLTGGYFRASLQPHLPSMVGAAVGAAVGAWLVAPHLWRTTTPVPGTSHATGADDGQAAHDPRDEPLAPTPLLQRLLVAASLGVAGFFAWGWWVRPDPDGLPSIATEGVNILSYLPQAATLSVRWLGWYLGPVPLAVAVLGLLGLVATHLGWRRRPEPAVVAGLGMVVVTLLLYLWSPSITPDHPWAMRRFAAVALPGLAVGVAGAGQALWAASRRLTGQPARRLVQAVAVGVVAACVVTAGAITWPVREATAQAGMRLRIDQVCYEVQPDDAVLVPIDGILALMLSVPLGVWCDVPTAGGRADLTPADVARLAIDWHAEGRRLLVLSSSETPVFNTIRNEGLVSRAIDFDPLFPTTIEPTLTSRPNELVVDERVAKGTDGDLTLHLYVVDVDQARRYLRSEG